MTTETESPVPSRTSFGRRFSAALGRFLKALIKVTLFLGIIMGIAYITYLVVQELQRSFNVVSSQVEYNREKTLSIGHDLGELEASVAAANTVHDERLAELEAYVDTTLAEDLTRQDALLTTLELQLTNLLTHTQAMDGQIVALNDGVVALQGDINENNTRLDALGGDVDALANDTDSLSAQVTGLDTAVNDLPLEDIEQMRQVVTLFRVWEMVTRARLRLVENNAGLAAADTALALATLEAIINNQDANQTINPELLPQLALVQARLTLANAYLPDNPDLAAFDLENSWRELDTALALLLGVEPPAAAPTLTIEIIPTTTFIPTATPAPGP